MKKDILSGISKVHIEIPQKILPTHWNIWFWYIKNLSALRFKRSYTFLNTLDHLSIIITWIENDILLIGSVVTNFIEIQTKI